MADAATEEMVRQVVACRSDFREYVRWVHGWDMRPHQARLFRALNALANGRLRLAAASLDCPHCGEIEACSPGHATNKLLALCFPGSGKSDSMVEFTSWLIGRTALPPDSGISGSGGVPQVGFVCYGDDQAQLRSVAVRDTMEFNPRHRFVFPECLPDKGKGWGQGEWFLKRRDTGKKDPTFRAAGITGGILGYRFPTLLVWDDPHDPKLVKSPLERDEVWRIWRTTLMTRTAQGVTPIVGIATRFFNDDLPGRVMDVEHDWAIIMVPALDENEQTVWPPEVINGTPVGVSTDYLLRLRDQDRASFLGQYMCVPPSVEGETFKRIMSIGHHIRIDEVDRVYQAWDTAHTKASTYKGAFNVGIEFVKLKDGRTVIWDMYRKKQDPAALWNDIIAFHTKACRTWGKTPTILVENRASGPSIVSFLRQMSAVAPYVRPVDLPGRHAVGQTGRGMADLTARAAAIVHVFDNGTCLLPPPDKWMPWREDFMSEMLAFGAGAQYDDVVAATVIGLETIYPPLFQGSPPRLKVVRSGW